MRGIPPTAGGEDERHDAPHVAAVDEYVIHEQPLVDAATRVPQVDIAHDAPFDAHRELGAGAVGDPQHGGVGRGEQGKGRGEADFEIAAVRDFGRK